MRKIYLDGLPRQKGHNAKRIDWVNSINHVIKFKYKEFMGELKITNYNIKTRKLSIIYNHNVFEILTCDLLKCQLGNILNLISYDYNYKDDNIKINNQLFQILERFRKRGSNHKVSKYYKLQCLTCNHEFNASESRIKAQQGCGVCAGKIVKQGVNDIHTTNLNLAKLLAHPDDGYKYTQGSNKRVDWKCPDCGEIIKDKVIYDIKNKGLSCPKCSDGISYPEKFIYNLLTQLNVEFEKEKTFLWSKNIIHQNVYLRGNKKYDFYITQPNIIIEVHGEQHYRKAFEAVSKRNISEEQENDKLKEHLAKANGITTYITINAQKSEQEWIQNSILNSELSQLYDLSQIDWLQCHQFSCNSLVKSVCELWNNGLKNIVQIEKLLNLSRQTIRKYLQQGSSLWLCDYTIESSRSRINQSKAVVQVDRDCGNIIALFESPSIAMKETNINSGQIIKCCLNKPHCVSAGGCKWMYLSDYQKLLYNQLINTLNSRINQTQQQIQTQKI